MTCVLALIAENEGRVYVGADAAGTGNYVQTARSDEKVFFNGDYLLGCSGSFRQMQVLRYVFEPPPVPADCPNLDRFMVGKFIPAARKALMAEGLSGHIDGAATGEQTSTFIVAYRANLWTVFCDFAIERNQNGIHALGSGQAVGYGALTALRAHTDLEPEPMIERAIEISAQYTPGVAGCGRVLRTNPAPGFLPPYLSKS